MPAILRIFLYQTDASLSVLGHCGSYDQGAGRRQSMVVCEHYAVHTLWVGLYKIYNQYDIEPIR